MKRLAKTFRVVVVFYLFGVAIYAGGFLSNHYDTFKHATEEERTSTQLTVSSVLYHSRMNQASDDFAILAGLVFLGMVQAIGALWIDAKCDKQTPNNFPEATA